MDDYQKGFLQGFGFAVVSVVLLWVAVAARVEDCKIANGYLTRHQKVYTVELFDTLDTPEGKLK